MFGKRKLAMLVAEFLGTAILTLVVLSIRSSGVGYSFFVALGAGLAVVALMLTVGAVSGGQFNPALTFGLWTSRKIKTAPAIVYIAVQLLGGACAYWLYTYFVKSHLQSTAGHFSARIMLAEAAGAFVFVWAWSSAAARRLEGYAFALTAGAGFAVAIMVASLASGVGVVNPAIALGVRSWGWGTYVAGPLIGAIVAANVQHYLFTGSEVAAVATSTGRGTTTATAVPTSATSKPTAAKSTTAKKKTTKKGKK